MSVEKWTSTLIALLLGITHRQWLYRNYIIHDPVFGTIATARKEDLLLEIECQCEQGDTGLLEENKYLAEVNLEEMASTSGKPQHYWLLAIHTARNAKILWEQRESQSIQTVRRHHMREGQKNINFRLSASQRGQRCFLCSNHDLFITNLP
jgi:hypothetical protein